MKSQQNAPLAQQHQAAKAAFVVHKFGGTSVANADMLTRVGGIIQDQQRACWAVVSAMAGVTDALTRLALAACNGEWLEDELQQLLQRHHQTLAQLPGTDEAAVAWLNQRGEQLRRHLHAVHTLQTLPADALARIQSLGEQFCAMALATHLKYLGIDCAWLDASDVLTIDQTEMGAQVDWALSAQALAEWRARHVVAVVIVTGFLARDRQGRPATLGRNGSDYTATIFGRLLDADEVQIWTDVNGVLSADPRRVPEAVILPQMSYAEACELAYFGAKVIHPQCLGPVMAAKIPLRIRNTMQPQLEGTLIGADSSAHSGSAQPVRGVSSSDGLALLTVEGTGMIGVPGTAQRVFAALHSAGVSVVMISQGSSEHSICSVVREEQVALGQQALQRAFQMELAAGAIQRIQVEPGISVLAAVGDGMTGMPGIAARLFQSLAQARINVRAIAQGSSELSISVALGSDDSHKALRAIHAGFWLSPQTLSVAVIGPGNVGGELLQQLQDTLPELMQRRGLDIRIRAIANSRRMLLADPVVDLEQWQAQFDSHAQPLDLDQLREHLQVAHLPHAVIVDCSASDTLADHYSDWLQAGIHIVTPNKHAGSGDWQRYQAIQRQAQRQGVSYHYETTVGAGLPVIQTLRDLRDTGDEVIAIEGIFSGTLAWLFNRFDGSRPFSELVREAHQQGYTEPDPRDDLDGRDVARKLVILAREIGHPLSLDQVEVESLVPPAMAELPLAQFWQHYAQVDEDMGRRLNAAREAGAVLRYVARLDAGGKATVQLQSLADSHGFARLRLTDNIVQFTTRRYHDNPLVVQGPGAGREVTAAGVFADLLRVPALVPASVDTNSGFAAAVEA